MSTERWLPVVGWEGLYEVSDQGRIRSSQGRRQPSVVRVPFAAPPRGYLRLNLAAPGRAGRVLIHRAVLEAFVGPCPSGMEGCHADDDPANNRLDNLRWDTKSQNHRERTRNGGNPNALKTHCPQGHPYDEENTKVRQRPNGLKSRSCISCATQQSQARHARIGEARRAARVAVAITALGLITLAQPASATSKLAVCHPTGKGYTLIRPAQASSHIDETQYPNGHYWKHEHDGRHDVYAVNGACPPIATPTTIPTTTPTEVPSSTPTTSSPAAPTPSQTVTTPTTSTVASPSVTSQPTSPSPTSSTPSTTGSTTTIPASATSTTTTPTNEPETTSAAPSTTSPTPSDASARPTTPLTPSPQRSAPSLTGAPPEQLPNTGAGLGLAGIGAVLLAAGIALSRKGARRGQH